MKLYHGTNVKALAAIADEGIRPRGKRTGNWGHTVESNRDAIYLTDAYPLHFAVASLNDKDDEGVSKESLAIIEIEQPVGDANLIADEDALEQTNRGRDGLPTDWDMERRTLHYREIAQHYSGFDSLKAMGTCAYNGVITPVRTRRVVTLDSDTWVRLVITGADPTITIANSRFLGERYRQFVKWMFGDIDTWSMFGDEVAGVAEFKHSDFPGLKIYEHISDALRDSS